jgi:putative flavoprotein involved in K+ transport
MRQEHAIVVGAGPAGLAAAAELGRRRIPAVVVDRGDAVGASWYTRYDRLRLNSSRWFSQLPGARYGR